MTDRPTRANDDLSDLIPTFVTSPEDIHFAEQANIQSAAMWAFGRRRVATEDRLLTVEFSNRIHRRMFGQVWRSAGRWTDRTTSSGVTPQSIEEHLDDLFVELRLRHDRRIGSPPERAIAIHNGLLEICAYRQGNARHARFMADLYVHLIGGELIMWSEVRDEDSGRANAVRHARIPALQDALDQAMKHRK